jgi:nicotinamide-nucleotide amidase
MPERNSKQAWLIPSAIALPNPVGTAPGWFVEHDSAYIAAMPGVPREMFRMWSEQVAPRLRALEPGQFVQSTTVKTIGIGESAAEQVLHDLVALPHPVVATYAKDDGVHVRVTVTGTDLDQTVRLRDETAAEVIRRLTDHVYGTDDLSLPGAIATELLRVGSTIAVADSGGGGRFAAMLASDPECARQIAGTTMVPSSKDSRAPDLADSARRSTSNTTLGLGLHVDVEPIGNGVFEGVISIAISGPVPAEEQSKIRSSFEDVQRRSALVAADVLLRALRTHHLAASP